MHAVIDESRIPFVLVLVRPYRLQQRRQSHLARRVLLAARQRLQRRRHASQPLQPDSSRKLRLGHWYRGHIVVLRRVLRHQPVRSQFQHRLHLRNARPAPRARLRRVAHRLQAAAATVHRRNDLPLRHTVAVAHLCIVRHVLHIHRGSTICRQWEQQLGPVLRQHFTPVERLQQARRGEPVTQQYCPRDLPVTDDHLLVHPAIWLHIRHYLVLVVHRLLVARHRKLHTHHLQLRRSLRPRIGRCGLLHGQPLRKRPRLVPQRRDQPVGLVAVLRALSDSVDVAVVAARQVIVHQYPAPYVQPRHTRQVDVRPYPRRNHQHFAVQRAAVAEADSRNFAVSMPAGAMNTRRHLFEVELDAHVFEQHLQHVARRCVKLLVHNVWRQMHHIHIKPAVHQPARRLQPQQAAADHGRPARIRRVLHHLGAVVQRAEREYAVPESPVILVQPVHHRNERRAARGDHQLVVRHKKPARAVCRLRLAVDADDAHTRVQRDVVLLVPRQRVDEYVLRVVSARKHSG